MKSFDESYNTPFANSGTWDKIELNEEEALLVIRRLHEMEKVMKVGMSAHRVSCIGR